VLPLVVVEVLKILQVQHQVVDHLGVFLGDVGVHSMVVWELLETQVDLKDYLVS